MSGPDSGERGFPSSSARNSRGAWILAVVVLLCALEWFFLDALEGDLEGISASGSAHETEFLLPLLHDRLSPYILAREVLLDLLSGVSAIDDCSARILSERIHLTFGASASYGLWSPHGLLAQRNLSDQELEDLEFLGSFRNFRIPFTPAANQNQRLRLARLFGNSIGSNVGFSVVPLARVIFRGQEFMALSASFWPDRFSSPLIKNLQLIEQGKDFRGHLAVLVPMDFFSRPEWFLENLGRNRTGFSFCSWAGDPAALEGVASLPRSLRQALLQAASTEKGGEVVTNDGGAAFVIPPGAPQQIVVFWKPFSHAARLARSPAGVAIGTTFLLLGLAFLARQLRPARPWNVSMTRKFVLLGLLACLGPTLGLIWTLIAGHRWEGNAAAITGFQAMEGQIQQLENQGRQQQGDRVAFLKQVFSNPLWTSGPPPASYLESLDPDFRSRGIDRLFLIFPDSPTRVIRVRNPLRGLEDRTLQMERLMSGFLDSLTRSLRMSRGEFGKGEKARHLVTNDLLIEAIRTSVDPANLIRIILKPDQIQGFQILHEGTWAVFHRFPARGVSSTLAVLTTFSRRSIEAGTMTDWVQNSPKLDDGRPSLALMSALYFSRFEIFPNWTEFHPGLQEILHRLAAEGGRIRGTVLLDGTPHLFLARPVRDLEFVALALRPDPRYWSWSRNLGSVLFALAFPLAIMGIMAIAFSRFFLGPVRALETGVRMLDEKGETSRLPILATDEIGDLCRSFNRMADGLREKEFLARFLSDLAMKAIAAGEEPRATRVDASILAADIRGFTTMSEEKPPEEIVNMLNSYLTRMEEIIERNGGIIDKFIGDAILALFLPVHGKPPAPERAVTAGWEMLAEVRAFGDEREARGEFPIRIGVGIGTGPTLLGAIGAGKERQDFTVTGPTVNLALSMEKSTKKAPGPGFVVCPTTFGALGEAWEVVPSNPAGLPGWAILRKRIAEGR